MDKYQQKKVLGKGGFGEAVLVNSKVDGRQYAMKKINVSRMSPKECREAMNEISVLSALTKHPCIVTYRESFIEKGQLCIVMDFCEGGDLYELIKKQKGRPFSEDVVLDWFVQICLSIKHIHDRKILHRDIKAQNIFLTARRMIRVGDFGIAKVLTNTGELAKTAIGTPYYLSPEICQEKPYDQKSDIWALGCLLYEMLTLKHAFEGSNMRGLVVKILRGIYPPISSTFSKNIRDLVGRMLAKDQKKRPPIGQILKLPFIKERIHKFLSQTLMADELSHTMIHRPSPAIRVGAVVKDPKEVLRRLKVAHEKRLADDEEAAKRAPADGKENAENEQMEVVGMRHRIGDLEQKQVEQEEQERVDRAKRVKEHEERIRLERRRQQEARRKREEAEKAQADAKVKARKDKAEKDRRDRLRLDRELRQRREEQEKVKKVEEAKEQQAREQRLRQAREQRQKREREEKERAEQIRKQKAKGMQDKLELQRKQKEEVDRAKREKAEQQRREKRIEAAAAAVEAEKRKREQEELRQRQEEAASAVTVCLAKTEENVVADAAATVARDEMPCPAAADPEEQQGKEEEDMQWPRGRDRNEKAKAAAAAVEAAEARAAAIEAAEARAAAVEAAEVRAAAAAKAAEARVAAAAKAAAEEAQEEEEMDDSVPGYGEASMVRRLQQFRVPDQVDKPSSNGEPAEAMAANKKPLKGNDTLFGELAGLEAMLQPPKVDKVAAENSMMIRLEQRNIGQAPPGQEAAPDAPDPVHTMMRRLEECNKQRAGLPRAPVQTSNNEGHPVRAEHTMLKRLEHFKAARRALEEEQPELLSPGGLEKEQAKMRQIEAEVEAQARRIPRADKPHLKGVDTLMQEVKEVEEAVKQPARKAPPKGDQTLLGEVAGIQAMLHKPGQGGPVPRLSPRGAAPESPRDQYSPRASPRASPRGNGARNNRRPDPPVRPFGAGEAKKKAASRYELQAQKKLAKMQEEESARVARENKYSDWQAKQAEKKAAKAKEELDHKMRLARMKENNAKRESDVKDVIRRARMDAAGAAPEPDKKFAVGVAKDVKPTPEVEQAVKEIRKQKDDERAKMRKQIAAARKAKENANGFGFELVLEPSAAETPRESPQQNNTIPFEIVEPKPTVVPDHVEPKPKETEVVLHHKLKHAAKEPEVVLAGSLWSVEAGAEVDDEASSVPSDEFSVEVEVSTQADVHKPDLIAGPKLDPTDDCGDLLDADEVQEGDNVEDSGADAVVPEWSAEDEDYVEMVETMRDVLVDLEDLHDDDMEEAAAGEAEAETMQNLGRLVHEGQTLVLPNVSEEDSLCCQIESLRMFLEKQLGEDLFIEVYRMMEDMDDDEEDAVTGEAAALLGENWLEPFQMIVRLLLCEDAMNNRR